MKGHALNSKESARVGPFFETFQACLLPISLSNLQAKIVAPCLQWNTPRYLVRGRASNHRFWVICRFEGQVPTAKFAHQIISSGKQTCPSCMCNSMKKGGVCCWCLSMGGKNWRRPVQKGRKEPLVQRLELRINDNKHKLKLDGQRHVRITYSHVNPYFTNR